MQDGTTDPGKSEIDRTRDQEIRAALAADRTSPVRTHMPSGDQPSAAAMSSGAKMAETTSGGPRRTLTDAQWLDDVFSYHSPQGTQPMRYHQVRLAARGFAEVLMQAVPPCADRTAALRKLREAVMTANAAIALNGLV